MFFPLFVLSDLNLASDPSNMTKETDPDQGLKKKLRISVDPTFLWNKENEDKYLYFIEIPF